MILLCKDKSEQALIIFISKQYIIKTIADAVLKYNSKKNRITS